MNRWLMGLTVVLGIGLAAVVAVQLQAYPPPINPPDSKEDRRTINTSGTATVRVKPDSARVFFSVITLEKSIREARTQNAAKVKQVIDAIQSLKIPNLKMKTSDVTVELVQSRRSRDQLPETQGYQLTNAFTVLVTDTDPEKLGVLASRVLDAALENGANNIQHIMFFKQDQAESRREALSKAVQAAEANARALASGANVVIKDTITISGQPQFDYYYGNRMQNAAQVAIGGDVGDTPLVAGDIEITCTVSVTCTY